eukprot:TRINITY_DN27187_c0_g1_i1.p1 TRINITY_DN27187_c0_g1~~TRINITY_DN27187_c0_g1_i1.p1  ORF type:complete len:314 (-),score=53.40 TRINITY_DN27187_c0_g1_i1:536-1477(-)
MSGPSSSTEAGGQLQGLEDVYDISDNVHFRNVFDEFLKARRRSTNEAVLVKRVKTEKSYGRTHTHIREIAMLRALNHKNVLQLVDASCKLGETLLVVEFWQENLRDHIRRVVRTDGKLAPDAVMKFTRQLLTGLDYCHKKGIMHRDLWPKNLLIGSASVLKIGEFALARSYSPGPQQYTHEITTLWYKAPEILLGCLAYTPGVDMWGVGCTVAEMATGQALFMGDSEICTLFKIFEKLGTPTSETWPEIESFRDYTKTFPKWQHKGWGNIRNTVQQIGMTGADLLSKLLEYQPCKRVSAHEALQHEYFEYCLD